MTDLEMKEGDSVGYLDMLKRMEEKFGELEVGEDLDRYLDILKQIPVKEHLKLKMLSRTWMNTIKSSYYYREFVMKSLTSTRHQSQRFIFSRIDVSHYHVWSPKGYKAFPLVPLDRVFNVDVGDGVRRRYDFIGVINGVILTAVRESTTYKSLMVLNPVGLSYFPVDLPLGYQFRTRDVTLGFSYCKTNSVFMVIIISHGISTDSEAFVYELGLTYKKPCWKRVMSVPHKIDLIHKDHALTDGFLHWIVQKNFGPNLGLSNFLLSFNLRSKQFEETQFPSTLCHATPKSLRIGEVTDGVCVLLMHEGIIQVHVKQNATWIFKFRVIPRDKTTFLSMKPMVLDGRDSLAWKEKTQFVIYDLKRNVATPHIMRFTFDAFFTFKASMLSPSILNAVGKGRAGRAGRAVDEGSYLSWQVIEEEENNEMDQDDESS